jgi:uncharacterized protein (TIGR00369 family)
MIPEGFSTDPGFDQAEDHAGPFYYRSHEDSYHCVFEAQDKNCNVNGLVHGGVLMTFADFALCIAATDHYQEESCATVSFNAEFIAAAESGQLVECIPRITRKTGSMVFLTGDLTVADTTVMTFSAVVKRLRQP